MRRLLAVALALLVGRLVFFDVPFMDDDLTHWLIARRAFDDPWYLLDVWGRPGFTILHALPARLGWRGCQMLSAVLSIACAWMVGSVCGRRGAFFAGVGFAACFFQPQFYLVADGALTETVYAFVMALALRLIAAGRIRYACLALSWGAISRLEGMPMLPIYAIGLALDDLRRPAASRPGWREHLVRLFLLAVFPLLWNAAYSAALDFESLFPIFTRNEFVAADNSFYGHGAWYSYLARAWDIHGPVFCVLVAAGCAVMLRRREHFVPLTVGVFWVMQSVLWAGGFMRTGGYDRFFVAITPAAAIAAAVGAKEAIRRARRHLSRRKLRSSIVALLAVSILWPVVEDVVWKSVRQQRQDAVARACDWIAAHGGVTRDRPLYTQRILPRVRLDLDPTRDADRLRPLVPSTLETAPPGAMLLITGAPGWDTRMPLVDFYCEDQRAMAARSTAHGEPWVHRLDASRLLPRYRQLADFSVLAYTIDPAEHTRWPYYVKILEVVPR